MSRENAEHVVHAHTDESGNTGHNLFDPSQPTFWTGTLLTERDPNTEAAEATAQAASSIGVGELHGADLGLDRVESVADILREQLVRLDSRLVFTRIEKRHYARLKLADTILDSGVNAAVSPVHYTNRLFRLSLALQLVVNVSPRSEEEFWRAYASLDIPAFQAVLRRLLWNVQNKVADPRSRQLLTDAISWGLAHPQELLSSRRSDLDAPNVAALGLLVGALHHLSNELRFKAGRFVADEQNQFAKTLGFAFSMVNKFEVPTDPFSWTTDLKQIDTICAPIEILPSSGSPGLQIIDVVLWLTKKAAEGNMRLCDKSRALVEVIIEHAYWSEITFERLVSEIRESIRTLALRELTVEDEERARGLIAEFEAARREKMAGSSQL